MRCEDVRELMPELAGGELREAGEAEVHLATCADCSSELERYRSVVLSLTSLRDQLIEPSEALLARLLANLPEAHRHRVLHRVATDERFQHAAFSVGGALVGAAAVGLVWWRVARRVLSSAGSTASAGL